MKEMSTNKSEYRYNSVVMDINCEIENHEGYWSIKGKVDTHTTMEYWSAKVDNLSINVCGLSPLEAKKEALNQVDIWCSMYSQMHHATDELLCEHLNSRGVKSEIINV